MGSGQMEKIGECNGVTLYFADRRFEKPGVYYWDGTDNVRAWPSEEKATQDEIKALRAELDRIEERGAPWVPELLEWLERHGCCPALPFTDYELIEALEARFGEAALSQTAGVPEGGRYFASGPEGCFFTEDMHLAEKIVNRIDPDDDWTITDLRNPTGAAPAPRLGSTDGGMYERPEN